MREPREVSLEKAIWKYATAMQRDAYTAAVRNYPNYQAQDSIFAIIKKGGEKLAELNAAYVVMARRLFQLVEQGQLIATGVQIRPELGRARTKIPPFLFDHPSITIANNRLENFEHQFDRVRIGTPPRTKGSARGHNAKVVEAPPPPKRGRPRVDGLLDQVVNRLDTDGALNGLPRKEQVNRVQAEAKRFYPNVFPRENSPSRTKILLALAKAGHGRHRSTESP